MENREEIFYLEEKIKHLYDGLDQCFSRIEKLSAECKKPYSCPCCNGAGILKIMFQDKEVKCSACKGKGLVWSDNKSKEK